MHKFFTSEFLNDEALIKGDDVKHAWKVLRLKVGDKVEVNDLNGNEYLGEIKKITKEEVVIGNLTHLDTTMESPIKITLFQGIPKGQKMELICQKSCELGVNKVVPLITERVVPEAEKEYKKLERLRRIILEASKQSKRSQIMEITEPKRISDIREEFKGLLIVPYEEERGLGIKSIESEVLKSEEIGIVIGPEGGFEKEEIEALKTLDGKIVTLGPRILRTETAGLVTASIIQYIKGDMGGKI